MAFLFLGVAGCEEETLVVFLAAVCSYGFKISHETIGIDASCGSLSFLAADQLGLCVLSAKRHWSGPWVDGHRAAFPAEGHEYGHGYDFAGTQL